jgi:hypothetical protein
MNSVGLDMVLLAVGSLAVVITTSTNEAWKDPFDAAVGDAILGTVRRSKRVRQRARLQATGMCST